MLTKLLEIREILIIYFKRFEKQILTFLKFILILMILTKMNEALGYATVLNRGLVNIALSIVLTLLPGKWVIFILGLLVTTHIAFASIEAALIVGVLLIALYFMYISLFPKMGYFILAVPLLFSSNLIYGVPIFAGLFFTPITIIPITFGIIMHYFALSIDSIIRLHSDDWVEMPSVIMAMYKEIVNTVFSDREMLFTIIVFAIIVVATYIISRLSINYVWYITIGAVSLLNIILFIIGNLTLNLNLSVGGIIWRSILAAFILVIIQFFKCIIDYNRTEKIQYEDDDYYYYVKAIPKIKISTPERKIKRIK
ncbi:hypothetical protein EDC18_105148 [Natranaerovirga pectinivora]|uniref:Uncharacterized protein n=1 Tax=Natranaerovirga pectinivora TaxID=682400 RepID=A0A4R3ML24_9FIRM|nr:hypothetical protein [Natranaerovirga pectinivora]TCT14666.1 hypothetical protein EDC18_105148 [Natranaerovirga pectinivora]